MAEQTLSPGQEKDFVNLGRDILAHQESGERFTPEEYNSVRERARFAQPFKKEIIAGLCARVRNGNLRFEQARALVVHLFGSRDKTTLRLVKLAEIELWLSLDIEFENYFQKERRRHFDPRLAEAWDDAQQPEVLEAEKGELAEREAEWLRILADLNSEFHPTVDEVIQIRGEVDLHEEARETLQNEIAEINRRIRDIKSEARKAKDEEALAMAEEVRQLDHERRRLRANFQEAEAELQGFGYGRLLSMEQELEHDASETIATLETIVARSRTIDDLLANSPSVTEVSEATDLDVTAEAYINVIRRIRDRIAGQPNKYKREFLESLARRLEDEAVIMEV